MAKNKKAPTLRVLFNSAELGRLKRLKECHKAGLALHSVDSSGRSVLEMAARGSHLDCIEFLLAEADNSPEHIWAACHGVLESFLGDPETKSTILTRLLSTDMELSLDSREPNLLKSACKTACYNQDLQVLVTPFLEAGASPGPALLELKRQVLDKAESAYLSAREKEARENLLQLLRDSGGGSEPSLSSEDYLEEALKNYDLAKVQELVKNGAEVNEKSRPTLLTVTDLREPSLDDEALELLDFLLASGADPNLADEEGDIPLHTASLNGRTGMVKSLLDAGAEVDAVDDFKSTALMKAADHGHLECVRLLLSREADAALKSKLGTALERARKAHQRFRSEELISLLSAQALGEPDWSKKRGVENFDVSLAAVLTTADPGMASRWVADYLGPKATVEPFLGSEAVRLKRGSFLVYKFKGTPLTLVCGLTEEVPTGADGLADFLSRTSPDSVLEYLSAKNSDDNQLCCYQQGQCVERLSRRGKDRICGNWRKSLNKRVADSGGFIPAFRFRASQGQEFRGIPFVDAADLEQFIVSR